ncbi:histidine kinase [Actinomadura rubrobrunea]|uniref:Histidine kinase n=1 Tax=Actinomadura rubrobrunea TaxID=115335 RepID=A0A9W6UW73_9ACTN|nr:ABC transporter permease [Actinomadura rubrobrunea]GLW63380.1 histidine kinase [Actinomadura rubrobrunea]
MTTTAEETTRDGQAVKRPSLPARLGRLLLHDRVALLCLLLVVLVAWMQVLDRGGYLLGPYDAAYMAAALESFVPLCVLALAETLVILSGRGGIDLSVGAMVSLTGMAFGFMVGEWGWPLWPSLAAALAFGTALGAVNGFLVAVLGFPSLIATLATGYAYSSLALVSNDNAPISTKPIQDLHELTSMVDLPFGLPPVPEQFFTFLIPCVALVWLLLNRTAFGRRLYAVGTNETAARYAAVSVSGTRFRAFALAGLLSGAAAIVTVGQFASARPDAGTVGNGMALPAITIAVLGGVAITGGAGRVGGVVLAALLVVWLNAGILLYFEGSAGARFQLLALGLLLVASTSLNAPAGRRRRRRRGPAGRTAGRA